MSKRELRLSNGATDIDPIRLKRRKEDQDVTMSSPPTGVENVGSGVGGGKSSKEGASLKEQGLELWNSIKNAVNKEGRIVSIDFMRQPSKRLYPDYYILIQRPVALEDIKKKLDNGVYPSLEHVKQDFELCFTNAKRYNIKESGIWKDAKFLHKLVIKEYSRISGEDEHIDVVHDGLARDSGDEEGEDKKKNKNKPPNMNRLLKSRLQKLVNKSDDSGRVLSTEFMELPSKKDWPTYYKEIKRPQCLENIFKHLKRKEYLTSAEFAADVELVFANALTFNHEHTVIWEDALLLRDTFRRLMSDLPEPHALPEYNKSSQGKLKLRVPATQSSTATSATAPAPTLPPSGGSVLRIPPANSTSATQTKPIVPSHVTPKVGTSSSPSHPSATSTNVPSVRKQRVPTPVNPATVQTSASSQSAAYSQHYPNASYQASTTTTSAPITSAAPAHRSSQSNSPAPPHYHYFLEGARLKTMPRGRPFDLDHRDGVKSWAMRLSNDEWGLCVKDVKFLPDHSGEDDEESAIEDGHDDTKEDKDKEEEEEESEVEVPVVKNGRKKGKGRSSRTKTKAANAAKGGKGKTGKGIKKTGKPKMEEVQVKLNGSAAKENEDNKGEWHLALPVGMNVVEIGEKGGLVWKVFAERLANIPF